MGDLNGVSELILYKVNKFVISFISIFIKYCILGIERSGPNLKIAVQVLQYAGHRWSILVFPNLFIADRS